MSKRSEERSRSYHAWKAAAEAKAVAERAALDPASFEAGYAQAKVTIEFMRVALTELEHENARLIAKLHGYVLAGTAKGPDVLVRNGTAT